jgi:hypothetical protein
MAEATIRDRRGYHVTGRIVGWLGKGLVEIETEDGRREIGVDLDRQPAKVSAR